MDPRFTIDSVPKQPQSEATGSGISRMARSPGEHADAILPPQVLISTVGRSWPEKRKVSTARARRDSGTSANGQRIWMPHCICLSLDRDIREVRARTVKPHCRHGAPTSTRQRVLGRLLCDLPAQGRHWPEEEKKSRGARQGRGAPTCLFFCSTVRTPGRQTAPFV